MKKITVVTTFHKKGLETYAQRFLDSFAKNVDKRIKLIVYAEDCSPINPDSEQITIFDQKNVLHELVAFKEKWKAVPKANGIPPDDIKRRRPRDHHKAFKWDAVRFSNKVYAVFDVCNTDTDWCVWMDADTYIHSKWDYENFSKILPDDKWITYVGRGAGSQTWPECGFYGLNMNNEVCKTFVKDFKQMYDDAEDGIFKLEEWHDSYVFGHVLDKMKKTNPNFLDYSADLYMKTAKSGGGGHPLINTVLGQWMDHMKGDRKNSGRSLKSDIITDRKETYWKT